MSSMETVMLRNATNARESICGTLGHEQPWLYTATRQVNYSRYSALLNYCIAGRKCDDPACRGDLEDTIINFGENLPRGRNMGA